MQDRICEWMSDNPLLLVIGIVALSVTVTFASWIVSSHMEASTFSRITGDQVTTWDAMWVQLRVDLPINGGSDR